MTSKLKLSLLGAWLAAAALSGVGSGIVGAAQAPQSGLPAIVGIRTGTPIADAYQLLKQHDAKGMIQYSQKRIEEISDKPITYGFMLSTTGSPEDRELIGVDITFPPSEQKVWRISRRIVFPAGHEPLAEAMLSSLRKTFGPELPARSVGQTDWAFDTQGHPAQGKGIDLTDCAQTLSFPDMPNAVSAFNSAQTATAMSPDAALSPNLVAANREACHQFVYVVANFAYAPGSRTTIHSVAVTITDIGAGIRAGMATNAVLNGAASAEQKAALKKAQAQPVPRF